MGAVARDNRSSVLRAHLPGDRPASLALAGRGAGRLLEFHSAAACASAEGVWRPTIAGASWTSSSFASASTMNRAKSTRRVLLLSRIGSPTCRLQTGRPWLSPSSRALPRTNAIEVVDEPAEHDLTEHFEAF